MFVSLPPCKSTVSHDGGYRGRFAPSPTGPLHFGSLVAAAGSFLRARSQGGAWLLRMEDLDRPRCIPGAADDILRTLERYDLHWDGEIMYQSRRDAAYEEALERLLEAREVFPCACSRKDIQAAALDADHQGIDGPLYPGTCRDGPAAGRKARSWRLRVPDRSVGFDDLLQGHVSHNLARQVGDFPVRRADGLFAYQLAVVVDDAAQNISEVVRGSDLLDSTPRQIYLQQLLEFRTPSYLHLPVALNAAGEKLSKQTAAPPLDTRHPSASIHHALAFLGQRPPAELARAEPGELWQWALENWDSHDLPARREIPETV